MSKKVDFDDLAHPFAYGTWIYENSLSDLPSVARSVYSASSALTAGSVIAGVASTAAFSNPAIAIPAVIYGAKTIYDWVF